MLLPHPLASIADPNVARAIRGRGRDESGSTERVLVRAVFAGEPVLELSTDDAYLVGGEMDVARHLQHPHVGRGGLEHETGVAGGESAC